MQENTYLIRTRCVSNKHARKIRVFRVAVLLMTAIIFCTLFMPKTAVSAIPERVVTYTVRPGDTLWNYAATITPKNGDISDNVERLMALNHLSSEDLVIGQSINVPLNDAQ
ncbi:LysM peptidoglycan-binding domain-containing protein [Gardnerella sp. DNF01192]